MLCPNDTEIPVIYELNGAALLGRHIVDGNYTVKSFQNSLNLLRTHTAESANGIHCIILIAAHNDRTGILDTAVHKRIDLLPERAGGYLARDGPGLVRKELDTQEFRVINAYQLASLTHITSDGPVCIVGGLGDLLLRLSGAEVTDCDIILAFIHIRCGISQCVI